MFSKKALSRLTSAALITAATAQGAMALDLGSMTGDERAAFRAEIRAYLLDNPEVIMEAYEIYQQRQEAAQVANDVHVIDQRAAELFEAEHDLILGNPEGDVVMVEFLDYRCGYCKKAYPDMTALLEKDGNIKMIVKEFPILGDQSVLAARFALATKLVAGDEKYHQVHDELMGARGSITEGSLRRLANGLELDADAVMAEMDSDQVTEVLVRTAHLATELQISGTPSFVMQGQILRGYLPYDAMVEIVAEMRASKEG